MKNAHRTEMEKELEKARKANSNSGNADMEEIRKQHEYIIYDDTAPCSPSAGLIRSPAACSHSLPETQLDLSGLKSRSSPRSVIYPRIASFDSLDTLQIHFRKRD